MHTLSIAPRGDYSLQDSRAFLCGFTPATGASAAHGDALTLSFLCDRTFRPATVTLTQHGTSLQCEVHGGEDPSAVAAQAARILSLDHDGTAMNTLVARDPVLATMVAKTPGFRPVCFASPYEAAVWGVLAQRVPMKMAARVKQALAAAHGETIEAGGQRFQVIPSPERMLAVEEARGVSAEKLARLHAVAQAARDGRLDPERLRAMPLAHALKDLRSLRGVGEWTAQHVLLRGTGIADALPTAEPRVLRAYGLAYGLGRTATPAELARASEAWRPLRMWVCVRLVADLAGRPEWHGPEARGVVRRRPNAQPTLAFGSAA